MEICIDDLDLAVILLLRFVYQIQHGKQLLSGTPLFTPAERLRERRHGVVRDGFRPMSNRERA
jgi:hypothetical protein